MTGILLFIRYKQLQRQLQNAGLYSFFFLGILFLLIFQAYKTFQKTPGAFYLTGFLLAVCVGLHNLRKDKVFVLQHVEKPFLETYAEYFVLVFPFAATSLFTQNWYCFPALILALSVIPYLNFTSSNRLYLKNISSVIPSAHFELISGIRKSFPVLVLFYGLALAFCWFKVLPLFLLAFITTILASFFQECEALPILMEGNKTPAAFLKQKLLVYVGYLTILIVPILLVNFSFQDFPWFIYAAFFACQLAVVSFAILQKYRQYQPSQTLFANSLLLTVVSFSAFVPVFLPVPVFLCLVYYKKAIANLTFYLND